MAVLCSFDSQGWLHPLPGCPFDIIHDPIPEAFAQDSIRPWSAILHSNAGPRYTHGADLQNYMARTDIGIECHFNVETAEDGSGRGVLRQIMPVLRRADCNADANAWFVNGQRVGAISFESQDNGSGTLADTPWTIGQQTAFAHTLAALHLQFGIPLDPCPRWDSRGVDYHSKFAEWSIYVGKTCPGRARIGQMDTVRDNAAALLAYGNVPQVPQQPSFDDEDIMYIIWRHPSFANHFLVGGGGVIHVTPQTMAVYTAKGVPIIVEAHEQMLKSCIALSGISSGDLVPV